MRQLALPRKLSSAFRDTLELSRNAYAFSSDVVNYLRSAREDLAAVETIAKNALAAATATRGWQPDLSDDSPVLFRAQESDEFGASTLDSKWAEWDAASILDPRLDPTAQMLALETIGNGSARWAGVYQPVPGSEFAVIAKCSVIARLGTGAAFGLFVSDDLAAPSTADFRALAVAGSSTAFGVGTATWDAYNGTPSDVTERSNLAPGAYLRIRCNGTTCESDLSGDGIGWYQLASVTLGFSPVHFGLAVLSYDNAEPVYGRCEFVRVFEGSGAAGINGSRIGRLA